MQQLEAYTYMQASVDTMDKSNVKIATNEVSCNLFWIPFTKFHCASTFAIVNRPSEWLVFFRTCLVLRVFHSTNKSITNMYRLPGENEFIITWDERLPSFLGGGGRCSSRCLGLSSRPPTAPSSTIALVVDEAAPSEAPHSEAASVDQTSLTSNNSSRNWIPLYEASRELPRHFNCPSKRQTGCIMKYNFGSGNVYWTII